MERSPSYYDWEMNFKSPKKRIKKSPLIKKPNSIGITENIFSDYVEKWKKKNLIP